MSESVSEKKATGVHLWAASCSSTALTAMMPEVIGIRCVGADGLKNWRAVASARSVHALSKAEIKKASSVAQSGQRV